MTAIADLGDLFLATSEYVKRADFANLFPRFVMMTENRISQRLRLEDGSKTVQLTADAQGRVALPTDFRELRAVDLPNGNGQLSGGALQVLDEMYPFAGQAKAFAIGGGFLNLKPAQAATIDLTYWAGIPRLTAAAPTNEMLLRYPDCYLYGCVREVFLWASDAQAADLTMGLLDDALDRAAIDNEARIFSLTSLKLSGVTP